MTLASAVKGTLNTGSAVTLQANTDVTISDPVTANNPSGNGGNLTVQAGRSVPVNADITTDNGNLTLTANDTVANGVVDAQRDAGNGVLTMAAGTSLNVGSGTLTVTLRNSLDKTYNARGVATLQNVTAASTVLNDGTVFANSTITGPVTVNTGAVLGGTGTVTGSVTVASGGTLAAGDSSLGTLTLALSPTLGGTTAMRINKSGATLSRDRLVVNSGLTYGGTLTVTASSDPLTAGDTFDLFDPTSFSGSFGTTHLLVSAACRAPGRSAWIWPTASIS